MPQLPDSIVDKASAVGSRLNSDVQALRDSRDLTQEAKVRQMAVAFSKARNDMTQLREGWQQTNNSRRESLVRSLFGSSGASGAEAISFRDAADRAAQLDNAEDALRVIDRARNTGDAVLARAVAQHAFEQMANPLGGGAWQQVVDEWAGSSPSTRSMVEELLQFSGHYDLDTSLLAASLHFMLAKPPELEGFGDFQIDEMAADESGGL